MIRVSSPRTPHPVAIARHGSSRARCRTASLSERSLVAGRSTGSAPHRFLVGLATRCSPKSPSSSRSDATELHLYYRNISAGQLVIVIHGFPTNVDDAFTPSAGGQRIASASGSNGNGRHGSPPSPLIEEAQAINHATATPLGKRLGVSLGDP